MIIFDADYNRKAEKYELCLQNQKTKTQYLLIITLEMRSK